MPRTHPPTLIRLVSRCLESECGLPDGAQVLVAVSGGPDSMALLHVLAVVAPRFGLRLYACGVDHGLRPEAARELALAEQLANQLGVPFRKRSVNVAPGGNVQARAREARYTALRSAAVEFGAEHLAVAHHLEDRAETVLLRLLRGAGPRGLAVLQARSGDLLRPMIRARRQDVELHLARHGIPCSQDPSNHDPRFLRSRVRHELLPLLRELSPGIVIHLAALADQLSEGLQVSDLSKEQDDLSKAREDACGGPFDASVEGVPLNREQVAQLRRALNRSLKSPRDGTSLAGSAARAPSAARVTQVGLSVPLSQETTLVLDAETGSPRIRRTPPLSPSKAR